MHIALFFLWSVFGVFLIVLHSTTNVDQGRLFFLPGAPSGGWLALILAAYNLIQWYARESMRKERQRLQMLEAERRERLFRERRLQDGGQIDPNFQFTDEPSPEDPGERRP
jgi:hypothetical protein